MFTAVGAWGQILPMSSEDFQKASVQSTWSTGQRSIYPLTPIPFARDGLRASAFLPLPGRLLPSEGSRSQVLGKVPEQIAEGARRVEALPNCFLQFQPESKVMIEMTGRQRGPTHHLLQDSDLPILFYIRIHCIISSSVIAGYNLNMLIICTYTMPFVL